MKETAHYGLHKPDGTDYVDIEVINGNMDAVEAELEKAEEHRADGTIHVTVEKKASWDAKETPEGARSKANEALAEALSADHSHPNKAELDGVTAQKISGWDGAAAHVSDGVRHLTAAERTSWNGKASGEHTHTAAQVGAVPSTGGTFMGDVKVVTNVGELGIYGNGLKSTGSSMLGINGETGVRIRTPETILATFTNDAITVGKKITGLPNPAATSDAANKGYVDAGLAGKAASGHTHTPASIGAATAAQGSKADAALPKSGGTLTGNLIANAGTDYSTARVRNIHGGTADLTAGSSALANGAIYLVYE